jgi:hypothetical protein
MGEAFSIGPKAPGAGGQRLFREEVAFEIGAERWIAVQVYTIFHMIIDHRSYRRQAGSLERGFRAFVIASFANVVAAPNMRFFATPVSASDLPQIEDWLVEELIQEFLDRRDLNFRLARMTEIQGKLSEISLHANTWINGDVDGVKTPEEPLIRRVQEETVRPKSDFIRNAATPGRLNE